MITKKDEHASFSKLAGYIAREEFVRITNFGFDTLDLALKEVEAVQALNRRSGRRKTSHLIASFRTGEKPSEKTLEAVEETLCKALWLEGHQRISALHTDTDNVHLHVAINKVDPVSHRNVEVFREYYRLDEACKRLEDRHGLAADNRIDRSPSKVKANPVTGRAGELETHAGLQSFKGWV